MYCTSNFMWGKIITSGKEGMSFVCLVAELWGKGEKKITEGGPLVVLVGLRHTNTVQVI